MVEVVNVVASGSLGVELDLEAIAGDLDDIVDYDSDKYPGAYFRFGDSAPLITLYRTGKVHRYWCKFGGRGSHGPRGIPKHSN